MSHFISDKVEDQKLSIRDFFHGPWGLKVGDIDCVKSGGMRWFSYGKMVLCGILWHFFLTWQDKMMVIWFDLDDSDVNWLW